jgi:hypothetical protein
MQIDHRGARIARKENTGVACQARWIRNYGLQRTNDCEGRPLLRNHASPPSIFDYSARVSTLPKPIDINFFECVSTKNVYFTL